WRAWLKRNHARKKEIWVVLHAKASGKPSLAYNDAVDEALCFGWIDSIVKKVGVHSRAQRFTPRREGAPVSEMNKARGRSLARRIPLRRSTSPARATANAYPVSQVKVMRQKTIPSPNSGRNAGASAATNWGSRLGKNTAIFGLVRLLRIPCRRAVAVRTRESPASTVSGTERPRYADQSDCAPRYIRYAAPASFSAA